MERKNFRIIDSSGNWVSSPTITVYITGSTTLASIFADEGFTAKANPFVGPSTGLVYFYAADGKYDVVVSGGTPSVSYTLASNLLDDTLSLSSGGGGISTINALSAATQLLTTSTTGSDFSISSVTDTHTFRLPVASGTTTGKLSSTDWTTFNAKIGTLNGLTNVSQTFAIGSSGTSPSWASSGGVHTLNLPTASASNNGILSAADWTTFNAKQNALTAGTSAQYVRGDLTLQTLNTSVVPEGSNLYYTDARVRAAISATSPMAFSGAGVISIQQSTGAQAGYLSSADWTIFNNKLSSLTTDNTGTDFSASTAAGAVTVHLPEASPSNTGGKVTNTTQSFSGDKTFFGRHITSASRRRYVRYHTVGAVAVAGGLDDIIVVNKTVAGATAVTLPAGPTKGDTYTIKDGKGDSGSNNITVSPSSGNIDGSATNVISTNYLSRTYVYNGVEWNVVA